MSTARVESSTVPAATTDSVLEVSGLSVRAGSGPSSRLLVDDVSFTLARGRTVGIVGESGSGKSMSARAVVGLLPAGVAASGSVRFHGTEMIGMTERSLRSMRGAKISLLLQDPFTMINPLQTVAATLRESFAADVRRSARRSREEVAVRLREVGLNPDVAGRHPFQLSGGMRQRVAIAAALASDPEVLLADEPTTALDVTTQAEVLALLRRLQRERNMALLLITHDLQVAFDVCDEIQVMYAGSVVENASAEGISQRPSHPYSHGLMLSDLAGDAYVARLVSIPGSVPSADSVRDRCSFADRCEWARDECRESRPLLRPVAEGHASACLRIETISDELAAQRARVLAPAERPAVPDAGVLLRVDGLSKTFRTSSMMGRASSSVALNSVSFTVAGGESVGVVGESGSGKTTLARSVLGLVTPDAGTIELSGRQIADYRRLSRRELVSVRQDVQVVFQDPYSSLNPTRTVGSALSEALHYRRDGMAPLSVPDLLAKVGLASSYASRLPAALSGGERQRVAVARAMAVGPRLLICDEPVAALDVSVQAQILELLREVRRDEGVALLFITHDLAVVRQVTDRVVVLYRGDIVEDGLTTNLLDHPQHAYTRKLVESTPGRRLDPR